MATNKIVINGKTEIDLTQDTVTAADVKKGKTFHLKNGNTATGSLDFSKVTSTVADVTSGKKFFDQEGNLQTGTKIAGNFAPSLALIDSIIGASGHTEDEYVTVLPEGLTTLEPLQSYTYQYGDYEHSAYVWLLYEIPNVSHHKVIWPDSITSVSTNFYWTSYSCPISSGYWHIYLNKNNFEDFIRLFCDGNHGYYTDDFYAAKYFDKSSGEPITDITFPEGITSTSGISIYHDSSYDDPSYVFHFPSTLTHVDYDMFINRGGGIEVFDLSKVSTPPQFDSWSPSYLFWSWSQILVPKDSLAAYKSATTWCDVADYIVPYPDAEQITFYIDDVEYTCAGGTTWGTFAVEHPELNICEMYNNLLNITRPTESYYQEIASSSYIISDEHYSKQP